MGLSGFWSILARKRVVELKCFGEFSGSHIEAPFPAVGQGMGIMFGKAVGMKVAGYAAVFRCPAEVAAERIPFMEYFFNVSPVYEDQPVRAVFDVIEVSCVEAVCAI